jgi:hypothetical protein
MSETTASFQKSSNDFITGLLSILTWAWQCPVKEIIAQRE